MFEVWWKRQDEWKRVMRSRSFSEARSYARDRIVRGHPTQRIEIREPGYDSGIAIWDANWLREW